MRQPKKMATLQAHRDDFDHRAMKLLKSGDPLILLEDMSRC